MPHVELTPVALLLGQIAAIIAVSRALGVVARWLGQPLVIAEVVAGIVLGPSLLGWLWPEVMSTLFPASSFGALKMVSQLGLVLFMFLVGLELDVGVLRGRAHTSVAISHASILGPFALGGAAAWVLHERYADPGVGFVAFVLFMGIAMSITAFPVLARILSEQNLLTSKIGTIAIACAAVQDVTAWCLLAFVVAVARAGGLDAAWWTTAYTVGFILAMIGLVRPFLRRLGARVGTPEGLTPTVVAVILLLLLGSAMVTELIGIHALFGSFLLGSILPKEGGLRDALVEKLESVAVVLLLPLFFAYSGLRTELGLLDRPDEWLVCAALIAIACAGKFGGTAVAARLTGLSWRESSAIGVLMNTRGLMELIVLNIGLDLGVISSSIFTMMVLMALVTTVMTTPILRWVVRPAALEQAGAAPAGAPFTILMCVSDPRSGPGMATLAAALAGRGGAPRLIALHLLPPTDRPSSREEPGAILAPLLEHAAALTLPVQPLTYVSTEPATDICRAAEERQASLVLIGWHKPLLLEGRLGGTVGHVVARSTSPVAVLVDRGIGSLKNVLLAFAGGPEDLEALQVGRRIAAEGGAALTLMHVVAPGGATTHGKGRAQIDRVFDDPEVRGKLRVRVVEDASPREAVLREAAAGYDLLLLGMAPRWGLHPRGLALRRDELLAQCPISVLAIHPPAGAKAGSWASEPRLRPASPLEDA